MAGASAMRQLAHPRGGGDGGVRAAAILADGGVRHGPRRACRTRPAQGAALAAAASAEPTRLRPPDLARYSALSAADTSMLSTSTSRCGTMAATPALTLTMPS